MICGRSGPVAPSAGLRAPARSDLRRPRRCGIRDRSVRGWLRNGRDWHTLIEFCGLVGTVIVDETESTIRASQ